MATEWKGLQKNLSRIKDRGALGMYQAMNKCLIFLEARIKESIRAKLNRQPTGRLSSDWSREVNFTGSGKNMAMEGVVGTHVKYARIHEKGDMDHRPKTAQALTVPFFGTAGQYPAAKTLYGQGKTFIAKSKSGARGIIFLSYGFAGGTKGWKGMKKAGLPGIPIYVLAKSVKIPARPYIKPVLDSYNRQLVDMLGSGWKATLEGK